MAEEPKRYKTDPYLRLDLEEVRRLEEQGGSAPPPKLIEAMAEGVFGPREDARAAETLVPCPRCSSDPACPVCHCDNRTRLVTPTVAGAYELKEALSEESNASLPELDSGSLDEETESSKGGSPQ